MTIAQLIPLVLQASIALVVLAVGLRASPGDVTSFLRRPGLLLRSLLSMYVLLPLVAASLAAAFRLRPAVEVAILLLAVAPVPPVLPGKYAKAKGSFSYGVGMLAVSALVSIVTVPLSVTLIGRLIGHEATVSALAIARVVATTVLAPLVAGMILRGLAPGFADRAAGPLGKAGTLLLVLGVLPIFVTAWGAITALVGDFTLLAIVLFTVAGLVIGHFLGGPEREDRPVLALSTAVRHPGVAVAIAAANATPEGKTQVAAAVLLCVLVGAVVTGPYVKWSRREAVASPAVPA